MRTTRIILAIGLMAIAMSATWQTTARAEMPVIPALYVQSSTTSGPSPAMQGSGLFLPVYYGGYKWGGYGPYYGYGYGPYYDYGYGPYRKHRRYRHCWWEDGVRYCRYRHHRHHHHHPYYY
jgi:hypothetical protein